MLVLVFVGEVVLFVELVELESVILGEVEEGAILEAPLEQEQVLGLVLVVVLLLLLILAWLLYA